MPYFLVIVLAPKLVFLNEQGEVIIRRVVAPLLEGVVSEESEGLKKSDSNNKLSRANLQKQASETSQTVSIENGSVQGGVNPIDQLESIDGEAVVAHELELTEINIRGFVLSELDKMYAEFLICARPTLVDDETGNSLQAMCICEKENVDTVIARLAFYGVGNLVGSINVLSLESSKFFRPPPKLVTPLTIPAGINEKTEENETEEEDNELADPDSLEAAAAAAAQEEAEAEATRKKKIMIGEAASQIRVEQVVETIETSAELTFDYIVLLSIASTIAGIGLATNNTVAIVASMLVSPIMGPVMACTFGTIVNKWSLVRLGAVSELLSLLLCCVIGACIALVTMAVGTEESWPTAEMRGRGVVNGLVLGLAIAIPSGMGVALSILGNNTASLVGVAISASLLPPAVNCGMCLAYAAAGFVIDSEAEDDRSAFHTPMSYANLGGVSLALTIVNIGAIYVSGCLMFRLKEVAPIQNKQAFWERDTHVFRRMMHKPPAGSQAQVPQVSDLEAQISLLKEVGRNKELRQQLMVESDDVLLGMTSGLGGGAAVASLLSATGTMGPRNRPNMIRSSTISGSSSNMNTISDSKPGKPGRKFQPQDRSAALLDLFRRDDVPPMDVTPTKTWHGTGRERGASVPAQAVDTRTIRTAPAHASPGPGYDYSAGQAYGTPPPPVPHTTATSPPPPSAMDIRAVKDRLRHEGKTLRFKSTRNFNI